jgi:hypothetical protein
MSAGGVVASWTHSAPVAPQPTTTGARGFLFLGGPGMTTKEIAEAVGKDELLITNILNRAGYIDCEITKNDIEIKMLRAYQDYIDDLEHAINNFHDSAIECIDEIKKIKGNIMDNATSYKNNTDSMFVYIAKQLNEEDVYKIGIARDIEARRKTFTIGNAYLEIIASKKSNIARRIEIELHKNLENKKLKGEWFVLSNEELSSMILEYCFNLHLI